MTLDSLEDDARSVSACTNEKGQDLARRREMRPNAVAHRVNTYRMAPYHMLVPPGTVGTTSTTAILHCM